MNLVDRCIKFVLFEIFFWLWGAPVVAILYLLPPSFGADGPAKLVRLALGAILLAWYFGAATWLAKQASRRSTYDYYSPTQSVVSAVNEARFYLSFLPLIGPKLAPKTASDRSPVEPT